MFDLIIKRAYLADAKGEVDVACQSGKIVEISKSILGESKETIEAHLQSLSARESELIAQYNEASESPE